MNSHAPDLDTTFAQDSGIDMGLTMFLIAMYNAHSFFIYDAAE